MSEDDWNDLERGEVVREEVSRTSSSGNGIVLFGQKEVNIGPVTEDSIGKEVRIKKSKGTFGICLANEYRQEDYFETHPLGNGDFYYNTGTKTSPEYRALVRGVAHPQSGDLFVAKIDRIGRNGRGVIDTKSGHDVIVEGVSQDDVGELVEAELIKTRRAQKVSDDAVIVSAPPSEDLNSGNEGGDSDKKELAASSNGNQGGAEEDSEPELMPELDDPTSEHLRQKAEKDSLKNVPENTTNTGQAEQYNRSENIKRYVKDRADGVCEGCGEPAPFTSKTGEPYLHAHHVHELSDGGSDTPESVIALCPNCHYQVHDGQDGDKYNQQLIERLADIEDISVESIQSMTGD